MPLAEEFSVCTSVAGCLCPIYCIILRGITDLFQLMERAPGLASSADARTLFIICIITKIVTFGQSLLLGFLQLKN